MSNHDKGLFICLEGPDGSGKTTQVELLTQYLKYKGRRVIATREPGGTEFGDEIRSILLTPRKRTLDVKTELMLVLASRVEHVKQVIRTYLKKGVTVISDRYSMSSVVYQGIAGGVDVELVRELCRWATSGLDPDLTIFLRCSPEESLRRTTKRGEKPDSMELKDYSFKESLSAGFRMTESMVPESRRLVIPEGYSICKTADTVVEAIDKLFESKGF